MITPTPDTSKRWKAMTTISLATLIAVILWDGADRRPADSTKPLPQSPSSAVRPASPKTLKLASFNIHSGKGTDRVKNLARTAELLADVDFAGLYEVRATGAGELPNQAAELARQRDAAWLFAATERRWWTDHFGNALVHRIPIQSAIRIPLINTRGKAFRNAILTTIPLEDAQVTVIAVHIDSAEDRVHQLESVIRLFLNLKAPCVLMGDLNTAATDRLLVDLRASPDVRSPLHDVAPEGTTIQSIDWIFTRGLKTISAKLVENTASDHPCLRAELAPVEDLAAGSEQ